MRSERELFEIAVYRLPLKTWSEDITQRLERATDQRPEDRHDQHQHPDDAHHPAHPPRSGDLGEYGLAQRHDHPATESLDDPAGDQHAGREGQAGQHRAAMNVTSEPPHSALDRLVRNVGANEPTPWRGLIEAKP